jgi:hypothetical protein
MLFLFLKEKDNFKGNLKLGFDNDDAFFCFPILIKAISPIIPPCLPY